MNCSTPGLPVHHQLPEFTQTHVHRDPITPLHSNNSISLQDVLRTMDVWVKAWYISYPLSYNVPNLM